MRPDEEGDHWNGLERLRRIGIDPYHVHLPKLNDAGLVALDAAERTVRPAGTSTEYEPIDNYDSTEHSEHASPPVGVDAVRETFACPPREKPSNCSKTSD
jgi:hypothetical protein